MKELLLFCTANDQLVERFLKIKCNDNNRVTMIIVVDRVPHFERLFPNIKYVTTSLDHIDYTDIKTNKEIIKSKWDEVWILSSKTGNYWSFIDCLCVVSELKYDRIFFSDAHGGINEPKEISKAVSNNVFDKSLLYIWFNIIVMFNRIKSVLLGYRW